MLLSSGQFSFNLPLLNISALGGMGWSFGLSYLSGSGISGALGGSFDYQQNFRLVDQGSGNIDLFQGNNTKERFVETSPGVYEAAADNNTQATLTLAGSGVDEEFTMTSGAGSVTKFYGFDGAINTPGRVKSVTDRYNSSQAFVWENVSGDVRVTSITDSYGRTVEYRYDNTLNRLNEIEDFLGRKLNFQYDSSGRLLAVVTPSILRAADGNTFPGGTAYVFQYDTSNIDANRRNDLIRIWYPNETLDYLDTDNRTVDVNAVYANATPRYFVEYGQDSGNSLTYGNVIRETVGDPSNDIGGTYEYEYATTGLPTNIIDSTDPIVFQATVTDRNGNEVVYGFTAADMPARVETKRNRNKIDIPSTATFPSYITWTKYNDHNQPLLVIFPEGNSVEYEYEDGVVTGIGDYNRRNGLLLRETLKVDNPLKSDPTNPIPALRDGASNGQTELTKRYFYDPLFNNVTAMIEERGNPIDSLGTYFTPQNGGTIPTDADRSRYATFNFCDYQKNQVSTVTGDTDLQDLLQLNATQIQALIDHVDDQMTATDGTGGLPDGFELNLGDINGDGTGDGAASGLSAAPITGNMVKVQHPSVRLIGSSSITTQDREEIFTVNARGQLTTHTDPEGNLTVYVRYPENDPEGDGQFRAGELTNKQYGRDKLTIVDADPNDVMSLVGADGDLVDFIPGKITRTNTPGVYQKLTTRYEGNTVGGGCGCASCAYDPLGNPLSMTDPRGFTTHMDRNEMGEVYRTTSPDPYRYQTETHYDANRNVVRTDTEDQWVQYDSTDPTSADYAKFTPTGSGSTAHVPQRAGSGGSIRPGWFTNLMTFDLLNNLIEENQDATGSKPDRLITTYEYDANQNLIKTTKPEGNTAEQDYDERNLPIATRVGYDAAESIDGSVSITAYGGNGNTIESIGPAARGASGNHTSATIEDAFESGSTLNHTGDFAAEVEYDGFDRAIKNTDAVGNVSLMAYDPGSRNVESSREGPVGGSTPSNRNGTGNVKLQEAETRFDEAGRGYESQQNVFVGSGTTLPSSRSVTHTGGGLEANSTANGHTATVTLVNAGSATANESYLLSRSVFDRAGRTVESIADNTAVSSTEYDGANRAIKSTDALGNIAETEYDPNGNAIFVTSTEKCTITDTSPEDENFRSAMRYDSLNRLVVSASQGADGTISDDLTDAQTLFSLVGYDSRSNNTLSIDPKQNTVITVYDAANRATQTQQHLRQDGQGANPPAEGETLLPFGGASITTITVYDANSRTSQLIDDNGNVTAYTYDTLDREVEMIFHDGSTRTSVYDAASDVTQYTDEMGNVFDNTFDPLGRKTDCDVTKATGVGGTDKQFFEYDGLSRSTYSVDRIGSTDAQVKQFYDSTSRVLEDSQSYGGNTRNVSNTAFESFPMTELTYPNGRQVENSYDDLYRRTQVAESGGSAIADWEFYGSSRIAECRLGNGLIQTNLNNARTRSAIQEGETTPGWGDSTTDRLGYDGAGRMITKRFLSSGINGTTHAYNSGTSLVGFTTEFDRSSNKSYERELHAENRSHRYSYDSLDRLCEYQRGTLASGGGSITTPISLSNTDTERDYVLDGLGNWRRTNYNPVGGSETEEIRQHNGLNQITKRDTTAFSHDLNGNLLDDGVRLYEWDAFNRLLVVKRKSDDALIGEYVYDARAFRIQKTISNGGLTGDITNGTTDFIYNSGWQCLEERDSSNNPTKQYVWGTYIDELIQQRNNIDTSPVDQYPLQDLLYRTTALTNDSGSIIEAYDTDAYGNTLIFSAAGTSSDWWANDATQSNGAICNFIFTGQRYDVETDVYSYRSRIYSPSAARFLSRDMYRTVGESLYDYVASCPTRKIDPSGAVIFDTQRSMCPRQDTWLNRFLYSGLFAAIAEPPPAPSPAPAATQAATVAGGAAVAATMDAIPFIPAPGQIFGTSSAGSTSPSPVPNPLRLPAPKPTVQVAPPRQKTDTRSRASCFTTYAYEPCPKPARTVSVLANTFLRAQTAGLPANFLAINCRMATPLDMTRKRHCLSGGELWHCAILRIDTFGVFMVPRSTEVSVFKCNCCYQTKRGTYALGPHWATHSRYRWREELQLQGKEFPK